METRARRSSRCRTKEQWLEEQRLKFAQEGTVYMAVPSLLPMSAYPPHLSHVADEIARLHGTENLRRLFANDKALAAVPWPRSPRLRGGHLFDRGAVAEEFGQPLPAIAVLDSETLWASQPSITRAGVEYYLSDTWFRTGVTYADKTSEFNRLPVVEARPGGVNVILNGHHRSCAALLSGRRVLARLVGAGGSEIERVDLRLPSLAVGPWRNGKRVDSVEAAVKVIETGRAVSVQTEALAKEVEQALSANHGAQ